MADTETYLAMRLVDALEHQAASIERISRQLKKTNERLELLGIAMYDIYQEEEEEDDPPPRDEKPETVSKPKLKAVANSAS